MLAILSPTLLLLLMAQLRDVLVHHTIDQLKSLIRCLPDASPSGKKDNLVSKIQQGLSGPGLHALRNRLDDTQRLAVAETVYSVDGRFHPERFRAKYGRLPDFSVSEKGSRYSYYRQPTSLALLLYNQGGYYSVPADLCEQLRGWKINFYTDRR